MQPNSAVAAVADALKKRYSLVRVVSDSNLLKLGIGLTLEFPSQSFVKYTMPREMLLSLSPTATGITSTEWQQLFANPVIKSQTPASNVVAGAPFAPHAAEMQAALMHTLKESDKSALFKSAFRQLLVYLALHMSTDDYIERVESVLGPVIRTDYRALGDLRASYVSETTTLLLLGQVVDAVVACVQSE